MKASERSLSLQQPLASCAAELFMSRGTQLNQACPVQTNPGLQKLVSGIVGLPFGLIMVMICGAELFTGNTCMCAAAFYEGRISFAQLLKNWVVSFTSESDFLSVRYPSRQSTDLALRLPHVLRSWIVSISIWCMMHLAICACLNTLCRLGTFFDCSEPGRLHCAGGAGGRCGHRAAGRHDGGPRGQEVNAALHAGRRPVA